MGTSAVIVIGAGAAGLAAARVLSHAGRRVVIVEARARLGGRIHTVNDPAFPMPVEFGAEFIHGRPAATWDAVRRLGLSPYEIPFAHHRRTKGRLRLVDDFAAEMAKVMRGLSRVRRDMTFAEYLRRSAAARRYPEAARQAVDFVQGFDAADPEVISAKSLAKEQEGLGNVDEEPQFRLMGGYGEMINRMAAELERMGRVSVRRSTVVQEIRWARSRVSVECENRSRGREVLRASRVIVTLPVGVLRCEPGAKGAVRFVPELADKRAAVTRLGSGPVVKGVLMFRDAFWEDPRTSRLANADEHLKNASFLHDADAPAPTWWTPRPFRWPVLTAWVGGPKAASLSGRARAEQSAVMMESLAMLFKRRRATMEAMVEKMRIADWAADPFARGAYSYEGVGGDAARRELAKPIEQTLFFAGEATDTEGQASTVAGALASGERAAQEVLRAR